MEKSGGDVMEMLTIGQMAKLNNISEQTLRLYDKIGLLKPDIVSNQNRYRYYNIKQSARLDMIQYMKSLGMTLSDIKEQLDQKDISLIKNILAKKTTHINEQLQALKYQKQAIERTIKSYDRYEASPPDGTILVEYIDKRHIYCIDTGINFYDFGIEVYEEMLRKLKKSLVSDNLPQIYFCNVGTILRKNNLEKRRFVSSEVFVFVDRDSVKEELTIEIPANTYLCIYCNEFNKEKEYINRLLNAVKKNEYTIVGDYICEVLAELPIFEHNERGMFLRLQVPIKYS